MKIVHLEDNLADAALVREILTEELPSCSVVLVESRDSFLAALAADIPPDLIIADFALPSFDGRTALDLARNHTPQIPFIFLSGSIGEELAIAAVRAGAYDYVLKDNLARLTVVIRRAFDDFTHRCHKIEDNRRLLELAGIIERANEAIVVSDFTGRITLWNNGAARLYGIDPADAVGRRAEDVLSPSHLAYLRDARESTRDKGEWQRELRITTRDGRDLVIDFRMSLVRDAAGTPSARLSIATDITEKKKLEEQFLRTQRLESLGLLAAGIAHDLNNVLAPVLMAAPLLRLRVTGNADLRLLDILEKSAARGAGLVRQIFGFARGVGGGLRLIQTKHLLADFVEVIQVGFPKSIVIEKDFAADLWPIQADPTQIHQILLNLAVNARDAMLPRGGTLRLHAANRILSEQDELPCRDSRPGAFLVMTVADTGSGMTAEVLSRIWEPFFTTKGEGKGTGLGLSTVRGIAAAHHGFVTVETQVGRGTCFSVFFPAEHPETGEAAGGPAPQLPRGHGELILVVDDEADVRDMTAEILAGHDYRVISCRDGVEAIGVFAEHKSEVRLVLCDVNMPNLDGTALALVLRRLSPDIGILIMTGLDGDPSPQTPESAPCIPKLQKPFTVEALVTAVHRTMLAGKACAAGSGAGESQEL
jgi:PAS domain S-box-containing protein